MEKFVKKIFFFFLTRSVEFSTKIKSEKWKLVETECKLKGSWVCSNHAKIENYFPVRPIIMNLWFSELSTGWIVQRKFWFPHRRTGLFIEKRILYSALGNRKWSIDGEKETESFGFRKINFYQIFFLVVDFCLVWMKIIFAEGSTCVMSV